MKDIFCWIPDFGMTDFEFLRRVSDEEIDYKLIAALNKEGPVYYEVRDVVLSSSGRSF